MQTEPLELNSYAVRLDIMYLAPRCRSAFDSGLCVTPVSLAITKCQLYGFGVRRLTVLILDNSSTFFL